MKNSFNSWYDSLKEPWRFIVALMVFLLPFSVFINATDMRMRLLGVVIFGVLMFLRGSNLKNLPRDLGFYSKR